MCQWVEAQLIDTSREDETGREDEQAAHRIARDAAEEHTVKGHSLKELADVQLEFLRRLAVRREVGRWES